MASFLSFPFRHLRETHRARRKFVISGTIRISRHGKRIDYTLKVFEVNFFVSGVLFVHRFFIAHDIRFASIFTKDRVICRLPASSEPIENRNRRENLYIWGHDIICETRSRPPETGIFGIRKVIHRGQNLPNSSRTSEGTLSIPAIRVSINFLSNLERQLINFLGVRVRFSFIVVAVRGHASTCRAINRRVGLRSHHRATSGPSKEIFSSALRRNECSHSVGKKGLAKSYIEYIVVYQSIVIIKRERSTQGHSRPLRHRFPTETIE